MFEKVGEIAFNPLKYLRDDKQVRAVYSRILMQRFDTRILAGHYGIEGVPHKFDPFQHTEELLQHLVSVADAGPEAAARSFWERFTFEDSAFPGVPKELIPILGSYFRIKEERTDLLMVKDMLTTEVLENGVVADIGCGRNNLGAALLNYADEKSVRGLSVIGTDINAYETASSDRRLRYRQQVSDQLPIDDSTVDLAIVKWALHHMNDQHLAQAVKEIARILNQKGRVAVIEALMGDARSLAQGLEAELANQEMWPHGEWFSDRLQVTQAHLSLSQEQQRFVLALEDYYGHWLEQRFTWMPMPFNYMAPDVLCKVFDRVDLREDEGSRRVLGMMPLIHWGPPTIRMVFTR